MIANSIKEMTLLIRIGTSVCRKTFCSKFSHVGCTMSLLKPLRLSIVFSGDKGLRILAECLPSSNRLLESNVQVFGIYRWFYLVAGRHRIGCNVMFRTCILPLPHFIFRDRFCFVLSSNLDFMFV